MDKKSIVSDLLSCITYISASSWLLSVRQKILCIAPSSIQKFDLEDTGKLAVIVAASEMTREYLIKQKILPDHIERGECSNVDQRCISECPCFYGK